MYGWWFFPEQQVRYHLDAQLVQKDFKLLKPEWWHPELGWTIR